MTDFADAPPTGANRASRPAVRGQTRLAYRSFREIDARWRLRTIPPGGAPALTLAERGISRHKLLIYTGD